VQFIFSIPALLVPDLFAYVLSMTTSPSALFIQQASSAGSNISSHISSLISIPSSYFALFSKAFPYSSLMVKQQVGRLASFFFFLHFFFVFVISLFSLSC
jgi:hypothetical protein